MVSKNLYSLVLWANVAYAFKGLSMQVKGEQNGHLENVKEIFTQNSQSALDKSYYFSKLSTKAFLYIENMIVVMIFMVVIEIILSENTQCYLFSVVRMLGG